MCVPAHPERSKKFVKKRIPHKQAGIGLALGGLQC